MPTQEQFVAKGKREPTPGLVAQVDYQLALGEEFIATLEKFGYPKARLAELREGRAQLSAASGAQKETWDTARTKTFEESVAISAAKELIGRLVLAVPLALRDSPIPDVRSSDFYGAAEVDRSATAVLAFLDRIRPGIKKIDAALKPYFNGESPSAMLEATYTKVAEANQKQEAAHTGAPESTRVMNEAKGRMLQNIEDMNRVARLAFYGRAEVIGRFNKDILLRARRSKTGKADPTPTPTPA